MTSLPHLDSGKVGQGARGPPQPIRKAGGGAGSRMSDSPPFCLQEKEATVARRRPELSRDPRGSRRPRGFKMAEAALELLERVSRMEEPLEGLRALRAAVHALPLAALRQRARDLRLAGLFALLRGNERCAGGEGRRRGEGYGGVGVGISAPHGPLPPPSPTHREQVSLCVSILERFLQALDPPDVIRDFRGELQEGLFHPDDAVKILTISQVGSAASPLETAASSPAAAARGEPPFCV